MSAYFCGGRTQLENSENLRLETQTTIETLREEFDQLVRELAKYKKKDGSALGRDMTHSPPQHPNSSIGLTIAGGDRSENKSAVMGQ